MRYQVKKGGSMPNPILILIVKRKWYDLIVGGQKRVEFRARKPHWDSRLFKTHYLYVEFRNGYRADSPCATFNLLGIRHTQKYHAIRIGGRVY
jgi:hypothetical protein